MKKAVEDSPSRHENQVAAAAAEKQAEGENSPVQGSASRQQDVKDKASDSRREKEERGTNAEREAVALSANETPQAEEASSQDRFHEVVAGFSKRDWDLVAKNFNDNLVLRSAFAVQSSGMIRGIDLKLFRCG